jgi:hypothetical protein
MSDVSRSAQLSALPPRAHEPFSGSSRAGGTEAQESLCVEPPDVLGGVVHCERPCLDDGDGLGAKRERREGALLDRLVDGSERLGVESRQPLDDGKQA